MLWAFSLKNWVFILLFPFAIPLIAALLGVIFLVVDTPISLITKNSPQKALKCFQYIAKLNIKEINLTEEEI